MIREPYRVFPYNSVLSGQNRDGDNNYHFGFNFGGDVATKYAVQVAENNDIRKVKVGFPGELKRFDKPFIYNGERVSIPVSWNDTSLNKGYVWRVRLVENDGTWDIDKVPTMKIQSGNMKIVDTAQTEYSATPQFIVKSIISGELESITEADLGQISVTLKQIDDQQAKFARVKRYESRYDEFLPENKGSFTLGKVLKESKQAETYFWLVQQNSSTEEPIFVSRGDLGLENIILKDETGVYTAKGLVTRQEFEKLIPGASQGSKEVKKIQHYKVKQILSDKATKVLTENGYTKNTTKIYNLILETEVGSEGFENNVTRKGIGANSKLFIKYSESSAEKFEALDDAFTAEEISNYCGAFSEGGTFGETTITYKLIEDEQKFPGKGPLSCHVVLDMAFDEEKDKTLLYEIQKETKVFGSKQLTNAIDEASKGQNFIYPITEKSQLTRSEVSSISDMIVAKDANGEIFSTYNLFTEEEKRSLIERQNDWGYYWCEQLYPDGIAADEFKPEGRIEVYKNFYDSNFYYFITEIEPKIKFYADGEEMIQGKFEELNRRAANFTIKDENNTDIKYYKWKIYRSDKVNPVYETDKIFSKDVNLNYGSFLNGFSYSIELMLASQKGGIFYYKTPSFSVKYEVSTDTPCNLLYTPHSNYISINWPLFKNSVPNLNVGDGVNESFKKWPDSQNGPYIKIGNYSSIEYTNIAGISLRENFGSSLLNMMFTIPRRIKYLEDLPKEHELFSFERDDGEKVTVLDTQGSIKLKYIDGINYNCNKLDDVEIRKGILSVLTPTTVLNNIITAHSIVKVPQEPPEKDNYLNVLPSASFLPETSTSGKLNILGDEADLDFYTYRVLIGVNTMVVIRYLFSQGKWNYLDAYGFKQNFKQSFVINKIKFYDIALRSFDFFNKQNDETVKEIIKQSVDYKETIKYVSAGVFNPSEGLMISIDAKESLNSALENIVKGDITGYQIYRNEYSFETKRLENGLYQERLINKDGSLLSPYGEVAIDENETIIDTQLIADLNTEDLTPIDGDTYLSLRDYSAHNRGRFSYQVFPKITEKIDEHTTIKKLGVGISSKTISLDDYYWFFTSLAERTDGSYAPIETWKFLLNLENGNIAHNTSKIFHNGNAKFPKIAVGQTNYISTSLSTLVGNFERVHNRIYDGVDLIESVLTVSTDNDQSNILYLDNTNEKFSLLFSGFNRATDQAVLKMRNQQRDIINWEKVLNTNLFKIVINEPFTNFIPTIGDTFYLSVIKDKDNEAAYQELGEYNTYKDNIEIVNNWNRFVEKSNLVLVKDIKGNAFIGVISNNQELYNNALDQYPTTISFDITQVGDIKDYIIFK